MVEEFNFLGLTMNTNLKWKKHTDKISNKCSKITGVLNRLKHVFPRYGRGQHKTGSFGDDMLRPSPNHGTQRLPNDDDDYDDFHKK